MGKEKEQKAETWASKMKDFGGGNFTFLSSDGETLTFIVVGLPILMKSMFKGRPGERIGCPVVTDMGYQLFVCGKRLARKISKYEKSFLSHALMAVRHGTEGDVNATYNVQTLPETETFKALQEIKAADFEEGMIEDSVKEALEVMQK